jgi:calcineurin-like phosphoesterase family protein
MLRVIFVIARSRNRGGLNMIDSKTFIIADTHFGDSNILKYEKRPFADVGEMDDVLIKNWNNTVSAHDTVIVAGDFICFDTYTPEAAGQLIRKLNGKKILILGNHDTPGEKFWHDLAEFESVSKHSIVFNNWFVISHEPPTYFNDETPYFWLYGHVHNTEIYKTVTLRSACVCCERWDYKPAELSHIVTQAKHLADKHST